MTEDDKQNFDQKVREVELALDEIRAIRGKEPIYTKNNIGVTPEPPFCSFCGKGHNQVERMVKGHNAHICNRCIILCHEIITELK